MCQPFKADVPKGETCVGVGVGGGGWMWGGYSFLSFPWCMHTGQGPISGCLVVFAFVYGMYHEYSLFKF